jgi:alpha-beta hydrolase superfamily lysophospholipase
VACTSRAAPVPTPCAFIRGSVPSVEGGLGGARRSAPCAEVTSHVSHLTKARVVKMLVRLLAVLGFALAVGAALLFALQRRLLYFPRVSTEQAALAEAERLRLAPWRDGAGALLGWRACVDDARAIAIALHGNAGSALDRVYYVSALRPLGVEVNLLEYPGYGPRPGAPSYDSLTDAALRAIDLVAARALPVWLVGESLGSGVAARAAALRSKSVRGLLLITPFADLASVARQHFPFVPSFFLRDRFRPARDLAGARLPVVVLVAGRDEVVTAAEGLRLFSALPEPKKLVEQPEANHNGLDLSPGNAVWAEAVRFLSRKD